MDNLRLCGLLQIICGFFVLDHLWNLNYFRLFVFGLFADYLKNGLFEFICLGII